MLFSVCQVISAAGAVKHEEVVELVNKLFTKLPSDPTTSSELVAKSPASFTGSEVSIFLMSTILTLLSVVSCSFCCVYFGVLVQYVSP